MFFALIWGIFCSVPATCDTERVAIKIVDEVSNYGWNAEGGVDSSRRLQPKVQPAAFRGPEHFRFLQDKCYTLLQPDYKYQVCFYNNVTQHERTMRWNPYSGILGVWTEWNIANYSFTEMVMKNGDDCGKLNREVEISFVCGTVNNLTSVSEPSQCRYQMVFVTPLVCHEDAMLVYPTLNKTLRLEWDEIEQNYYNNFTTEKGYKYYLANFFYKAGLKSTPAEREEKRFEGFDSLETCNAKYAELLKENESLKNPDHVDV